MANWRWKENKTRSSDNTVCKTVPNGDNSVRKSVWWQSGENHDNICTVKVELPLLELSELFTKQLAIVVSEQPCRIW